MLQLLAAAAGGIERILRLGEEDPLACGMATVQSEDKSAMGSNMIGDAIPETMPRAEIASVRDRPDATSRAGNTTEPAEAMPLVKRAEADTGSTIRQKGSSPDGGGQTGGSRNP